MDNVIVSGASRGLGLGIARRLAGSGFGVIGIARSESDEFRQAAAEIQSAGRGFLKLEVGDLADIESIPSLVKSIRNEVGPIYGLVNNAGSSVEGLLATMPTKDIESLLTLNVLSPIILTKYVVRGMMSEGRGRVVNISSIVASTGFRALSVYSATKSSLIGFTKSLAREVGRVGITVNAVAPGFTATKLTEGLKGDSLDRVVRQSALGRLTEIEDIAAMVAFLMGEDGKNVTGSIFTVDAGRTA